jgi:hypothetical protein
MNLHSKIMNIPEPLCEGMARRDALLFKTGHRDARHVAAELANEADAINAELLEALKCNVAAFDGDPIEDIEAEYGFATAQRIAVGRAAITKAEGKS